MDALVSFSLNIVREQALEGEIDLIIPLNCSITTEAIFNTQVVTEIVREVNL